MIGVILAAGVGSRLRPMTNTKPKCLVTTAGKPILQYQIDAYKKAGVEQIVIVVGYEGGAIIEYCKHIKDLDVKVISNEDYEITNNMYSLYLVREYVSGQDFVLNNADLSVDPSIVKQLIEYDAKDAIAVDTSLFNEESMKVTLGADGYINDISKKIEEKDSHACSIDFYKFSATSGEVFFDEIKRIIEVEKNYKDWTEVAMQRLFQTGNLKFSPCDISGLDWVEIDNYTDLALSDRKFSKLDDKMSGIESVLFDLDGTIYVGGEVVEGAPRVISILKQQGKKVYFLSNNSSKNKEDYVRRLLDFGISTTASEIVLSTDALIEYMLKEKVEKLHVLGTTSFKKVLADEGFDVESADPEYVVIGYDTELDYKKLISACRFINAGTDILATHCDVFCPSENGPIPDIGALLEMIRLTTGKEPKRVFGKPSVDMIAPLIRKFSLDPATTVIVGDRLHTDILMAKNLSSLGLLVLTGETTRDQLEDSSVQPDFTLTSIGDLYQ